MAFAAAQTRKALALAVPNPLGLVLISATMAFGAVLEVTDTFLQMFLSDIGLGMLVTGITGVAVIALVKMTTGAIGGMVAVKFEIAFMREGRRAPFFGLMAGLTFAYYALMHAVFGLGVAIMTIRRPALAKQAMVEAVRRLGGILADVVRMTAGAIFLGKALMKTGSIWFFGTDRLDFVAGDAFCLAWPK
jgi:hypothetical protein